MGGIPSPSGLDRASAFVDAGTGAANTMPFHEARNRVRRAGPPIPSPGQVRLGRTRPGIQIRRRRTRQRPRPYADAETVAPIHPPLPTDSCFRGERVKRPGKVEAPIVRGCAMTAREVSSGGSGAGGAVVGRSCCGGDHLAVLGGVDLRLHFSCSPRDDTAVWPTDAARLQAIRGWLPRSPHSARALLGLAPLDLRNQRMKRPRFLTLTHWPRGRLSAMRAGDDDNVPGRARRARLSSQEPR